MPPRVQLIRNATGSPSYAVIPWDDYRRLAGPQGRTLRPSPCWRARANPAPDKFFRLRLRTASALGKTS